MDGFEAASDMNTTSLTLVGYDKYDDFNRRINKDQLRPPGVTLNGKDSKGNERHTDECRLMQETYV